MADGVSVDMSAMAAAIGQVDQARQALAAIRTRVAGTVDGTRAGYQSESGTAFRNVMSQWDQDFGTIVAGLDRIHTALTRTQAAYQESHKQGRASANSLMAELNNPSV